MLAKSKTGHLTTAHLVTDPVPSPHPLASKNEDLNSLNSVSSCLNAVCLRHTPSNKDAGARSPELLPQVLRWRPQHVARAVYIHGDARLASTTTLRHSPSCWPLRSALGPNGVQSVCFSKL